MMRPWLSLTVIAAAARLFTLGAESFWYDEAFTAWLVQLPVGDMLAAIKGDVHPPLWYAVARLFASLGVSEWALRLPAALAGIASVLLVYRIALDLRFRPRVAYTAGLLAALLPASIYYGQEARMYTLLACFVLLMVWGALRGNSLALFAGGAGAVYTQNLGLFYVAAIGLILLADRHRWPLAALALPGIALLWLPWGAVMIEQARDVADGFWLHPLTAPGVLWPLASMSVGWRVPDVLTIPVYGAAIGATLFGIIAARRWLFRRDGRIVLAAAFGAPLLIALVSFAWHTIYLPRALLPSALLLCLFWAWALHGFAPGNRRAAAAILIPALAVGMISHYTVGQRSDMRSWTAHVRDNWQPGDVIYHTAVHTAILSRVYLPDLPYALRPAASDLNQSLTERTKAAMHIEQATLDDLLRRGYHRIWLMTYTTPMSRSDELAEIARITETYATRQYARSDGLLGCRMISLLEGIQANAAQ